MRSLQEKGKLKPIYQKWEKYVRHLNWLDFRRFQENFEKTVFRDEKLVNSRPEYYSITFLCKITYSEDRTKAEKNCISQHGHGTTFAPPFQDHTMISASFKELGLQPITTSPRRRFQRRLTSAWDVGRAHLPMLLSTMLLIACALTPLSSAAAGEKIERRLNVGGQTRSYTAYLPDRRASSALRVLIAFHPALANGEFMERNTQLHNTPGAENFIVVYPDGLRRTWNAGACCGMAERMNADDLGFFDAMMADLRTIAPVRAKAYVTGYSNGALMVYQLACKRPERLAAAAPFAAYLPPETLKRCPGGRVPLMHMHGDSDAGAPVEGGQTSYLGKLPPAIDTIAVMARRNGCAMGRTGRQSTPDLDTHCTTFTGCSDGAETMLCVIPELGHAWPGMRGRPGGKFGPARGDLQGSEAVIAFFMRH